MQQLLAAGADADRAATCKDSYESTPLQMAARFDQPEAGRQLLPGGLGDRAHDGTVPPADTSPESAGLAAFRAALESGSSSCMQVLLAAGALSTAADAAAAMMAAVQARQCWAVQQLLDAGVPVSVQQPGSGKTPLHLAALRGDTDMVCQLLQAGASITVADSSRRQVLTCAVESRSISTLKAVLAAAAAAGAATAHEIVNAADRSEKTPLHHAAALPDDGPCSRTAVVQLLLHAGAAPSPAANSGSTPLHAAAHRGSAAIVWPLLAAGANAGAANNNGNTPLHLAAAAKAGHAGVVKLLLAAGAPVNAVNTRSEAPLHLAVKKGSEDIVQQLLVHT